MKIIHSIILENHSIFSSHSPGNLTHSIDDSVLIISVVVYAIGFLVNGFVSGSLYKQSFFPRTSPGWKRVLLFSALFFPGMSSSSLSSSSDCTCGLQHHGARQPIGRLARLPLFRLLQCLVVVRSCLPSSSSHWNLGRQSVLWQPKQPLPYGLQSLLHPSVALLFQPHRHHLHQRNSSFWLHFHRSLLRLRILVELPLLLHVRLPHRHHQYSSLFASCYRIVILLIVQICVSIVGTYLLLNSENYHWWWTSLLSGASTGFYLFLYSIYFYVSKTHMHGLVQGVSFFIESVCDVFENEM